MTGQKGSASAPGRRAGPISIDELRSLFLFERLDDAQLARLAEHGEIREYDANDVVFAQGEPATEFFVLLEGTLALGQRVQDGELETVRTDYRGSYSGAVQAYLGERLAQVYLVGMRMVSDGRFFVLPADVFASSMREWFPMAMHLLEGMWLARQNIDTVVGQRERLLALGQLSAGLTHELNNPAAAAARATAALRERVSGMRHKLAMLANEEIDRQQLQRLTALQEDTVERASKATRLSPLQVSDAEDALAEWLEEHEVGGAYELAGVFAPACLDIRWAQEVAAAVDAEQDEAATLEQALRWLAYTVETESLMREIEDATARISSLLGAVRQYSRMDRAPYEATDVREGLESTLAMLGHKVAPGVRVVREYDADLPLVPAYAGELNQVWTNLLDNALQAMGEQGTLTLRAHSVDGPARQDVVVEVVDTGPGIPDALRSRIFEPFFTTKPIGVGTGLGLDIAWRIVTIRHRGELRVDGSPGDTRFSVRLPRHARDLQAVS